MLSSSFCTVESWDSGSPGRAESRGPMTGHHGPSLSVAERGRPAGSRWQAGGGQPLVELAQGLAPGASSLAGGFLEASSTGWGLRIGRGAGPKPGPHLAEAGQGGPSLSPFCRLSQDPGVESVV